MPTQHPPNYTQRDIQSEVNAKQLARWIKEKHKRSITPPGCHSDCAPSPNGDKKRSCTIGIVDEHRFAFYYWALFSREKKNAGVKPILLTVDSHIDRGNPNDVIRIQEELDHLHNYNQAELGLFSWLRLKSGNDGHIFPALYLNLFSETHVLLNWDVEPIQECNSICTDKFSNKHKIISYNSIDKLLKDLKPDTPIYLDIDLDFFVTPESLELNWGAQKMKSVKEISSFLSLEGQFMSSIFKRIVGLTIALEPEYCGGLMNSFRILDILNQELFAGTLLTDKCKWNK